MYTSTDSGDHWTACPNTNLANLNVLSLVSNRTGGLYAGTENGVYTSARLQHVDRDQRGTAMMTEIVNMITKRYGLVLCIAGDHGAGYCRTGGGISNRQ